MTVADGRGERGRPPARQRADRSWDDGLIARRARSEAEDKARPQAAEHTGEAGRERSAAALGGALLQRLDALRELVGLSRARLDPGTLAEAGRVLEEAAARQRHALDVTVVAIAGSTGSGKSTLFNALARSQLSEAGVRRPTTAAAISCTWTDRADGLLDRMGIPPRCRRQPPRPYDPALSGLILLDLPDHDSAAPGHREQVDRLLGLVDAVIWVVDPEKYADAVLHERYLRPLAGYAEVTFVVLNQTDRLSPEAVDQVLDDLRRLLDEDGLALGEHGEPGAAVLALSALTGEGVGELRETLGQFAGRRCAAELRLAADVDGVSARLRSAYVAEGRPGLTDRARRDFEDRLAEAVGARASGLAAERMWRREAERACGTPWGRLRGWYGRIRSKDTAGGDTLAGAEGAPRRTASRPLVEQAVRVLAQQASDGLPGPWAQAVHEAAVRGARGLAEALDEVGAAGAPVPPAKGRWPGTGGRRTGVGRTRAGAAVRPVRPRWWAMAAIGQAVLLLTQLLGLAWLSGVLLGELGGPWWLPPVVSAGGGAGAPLLAWCCRVAARGPAKGYALETERRLRAGAAGCGRERVLEPVAAELLRYREVRAQYVIATGEG
ncbi:GTPase [Streptomyces orinoci]|uniref:GTPase n=1 Tax=Streptomyces orinoci TaxID=67339 RepID=A0ABV3JR45_STRON|nr:GTPase [Streptomyces orinoci]